jgi:dihydrofolate synthase/folylpolyglutamate synthase
LEVGLGGRLDATNVAEPAVSVLGPVGLDHADVLGPDTASIAREKAGILRPSSTVICAWQPPDAAAVIREAAQAQRCRLIEYDAQIIATIGRYSAEGLELAVQGVRGEYGGIRLPLLGRHQAENAAIAVSAVEALTDRGAPRTAVRKGLAKVRWPGRLEIVARDPLVMLDGGHNPQAARALRATVEELWPDQPRHLVIGMSSDKPLAAVAEILGPMAATVTCASSGHPRACPAEALAERFRQVGSAAHVIEDPLDACTCAMNAAGPGDVVIVAGSLFLVAKVRSGFSARRSRSESRPGQYQRMEVGSCQ